MPSSKYAEAGDGDQFSPRNSSAFIPNADSPAYGEADWSTICGVYKRYGHKCWLCKTEFDIVVLTPSKNVGTSIEQAESFPSPHMFEEKDYASREVAAKKGVEMKRSLQPISPEGVLCRPYIIHNKGSKSSFIVRENFIDWSEFPKPYFGCPQTLILRELGACFYPAKRTKVKKNEKEEVHLTATDDVLETVMKLVSLWNRPDPEVRPTRKGARKRKRKRSELEEGENDSEQPRSINLRSKDKALTISNLQKQEEKYQAYNHEELFSQDPIIKARAKRMENRLARVNMTSSRAIGPDKTSSDMMAKVVK